MAVRCCDSLCACWLCCYPRCLKFSNLSIRLILTSFSLSQILKALMRCYCSSQRRLNCWSCFYEFWLAMEVCSLTVPRPAMEVCFLSLNKRLCCLAIRLLSIILYILAQRLPMSVSPHDELAALKTYVRTLQSENQSRGRERISLQKHLQSLLQENAQLQSISQRAVDEKNHQLAVMYEQLLHAQREVEVLRATTSTNAQQDIMGGIAMLRNEVDSLQLEIARAKREFQAKQADWDAERRGLLQEIAAARGNTAGNDIKNDFATLKQAYSRLESELTSRIRSLQSEKTRLSFDNDNLRSQRQRLLNRTAQLQRNKPQPTSSNTTHRIAQLNSLIADLNNQLQLVSRDKQSQRAKSDKLRQERDQLQLKVGALERQGQRSISEDRIKELTSLIEDLNLDRNRIRAELDGIRVDRDRLQLRVGDLERALQQRPAQASQELEIYAKKIAELDREKQALLVEISRLRTTMQDPGRIRAQLAHKESQWLRQRTLLLNQLTPLRAQKSSIQKSSQTLLRRTQQLQRQNLNLKSALAGSQSRQASLLESKKFTQTQLSKSKNQLAGLITSNSVLQAEVGNLQQSVGQLQLQIVEFGRVVEINKELEKRVYILETANYNLSEELNKSIQTGVAGGEQLIQALKTELLETKIENQKLIKANRDMRSASRSKGNRGDRSDRRYGAEAAVPFEQFENRESRRKMYSSIPEADRSKWNNLQVKINSLRAQNDELKKNLNFGRV